MGRQARFFAAALGEDPAAGEQLPPAEVFVTGETRWRSFDAWPPPTADCALHLRSGGAANARAGDGRLSWEPAAEAEPADAFLYDPADPVPSTGGRTFFRDMAIHANVGPREQERVESRQDVLVYTSDALARPLEVAGTLDVTLFVTTSAQDTDFTARVADVHPDGRSYLFADGIVRLSLRDGARERRPVTPGEPCELRIGLGHLHHVFGAGHCIRLQVMSSDFPRSCRIRTSRTASPTASCPPASSRASSCCTVVRTPRRCGSPVVARRAARPRSTCPSPRSRREPEMGLAPAATYGSDAGRFAEAAAERGWTACCVVARKRRGGGDRYGDVLYLTGLFTRP